MRNRGADLPDIIAAFEACDIDGDNSISASELHAVLVAIGANITQAEVMNQIKRVKDALPVRDAPRVAPDSGSVATAAGGSQYNLDDNLGIVVRKQVLAHREKRKKAAGRARYAERGYATLALGLHRDVDYYHRHHEEEHKTRGETAHGWTLASQVPAPFSIYTVRYIYIDIDIQFLHKNLAYILSGAGSWQSRRAER